MNARVDEFLEKGCGRCSLWNTPKCKALQWTDGMVALRKILLQTEMQEEVKWGFPCYTWKGKNSIMIQAFKSYFALMFFKGSLIEDKTGMLTEAGENSRVARQIRFTDSKQVKAKQKFIQLLIQKAIEIERSGKKPAAPKNTVLELPKELIEIFSQDAAFKKAFYLLTPGRQRGYQIYFSQPKQAQTRLARIEKYRSMILQGVGIHDSYKTKKNEK